MYTYELTPNLKTKSYRVLDNGVEIARSLAKKTAKVFCETYNHLLNQLEKTNVYQPDAVSQSTSSSCSDRVEKSSFERLVPLSNGSGEVEELRCEESQYPATLYTQRQPSEISRQLDSTSRKLTASAEEHGKRAEEHGRNIIEIQQLRKELIPFLLNIGKSSGGSQQNQVPQLQPSERSIRTIFQTDLGDS